MTMKAAEFNDRPVFSLLKQSDIVSFFHLQMPRWLFCDSRYKGISLEAKVAYTFLLNRFQLSRMNGWVNSDNEVFVVFTREAMAEEMGVSVRKAMECFKELSSVNLIWERRLGRGYPNQIYLASVEPAEKDAGAHSSAPFEKGRPAESAGLEDGENPQKTEAGENPDMQKPQVLNCKNGTSGPADTADQDLQETQANNIEYIHTELNEIEKSPSGACAGKLEALLAGCGLEELPPETAGMLRNAVERLWYADSFTVDGIGLPKGKIRADLLHLHSSILWGTLDKLKGNTTERIRNSTAYVMAALMNNIWEYTSDALLDPEMNRLEQEVKRIASQVQEVGK